MGDVTEQNSQQISQDLEDLSKTLEDLQSKPLYVQLDINSATIKAFLEVENRSNTILSQEPELCKFCQLLDHLKSLINELNSSRDYGIWSFIRRRLLNFEIPLVAASIRREIQVWFDRESIEMLVRVLQESLYDDDKMEVLERFENRISQGFDGEVQDLILRWKVFPVLESILCDTSMSTGVREKSAMAIAALARFNKDVFVGQVLMGFTVRALVLMGTRRSLQVLTFLVKLIKGHLVDDIELNGEIPRIISTLASQDISVQTMAIDCILEMAYFSRKEGIETMLKCGLIEKLVFLQRLEIGCDSKGANEEDDRQGSGNCEEADLEEEIEREDRETLKSRPFSGCVAGFSVQVEVGSGTEKSEKKELKMEILRRARDASVSEAEAATIVAEILWGSSL